MNYGQHLQPLPQNIRDHICISLSSLYFCYVQYHSVLDRFVCKQLEVVIHKWHFIHWLWSSKNHSRINYALIFHGSNRVLQASGADQDVSVPAAGIWRQIAEQQHWDQTKLARFSPRDYFHMLQCFHALWKTAAALSCPIHSVWLFLPRNVKKIKYCVILKKVQPFFFNVRLKAIVITRNQSDSNFHWFQMMHILSHLPQLEWNLQRLNPTPKEPPTHHKFQRILCPPPHLERRDDTLYWLMDRFY